MSGGRPYDREAVIAAYRRTGNVRAACDETGAPPYVAYIWLRKAGALSVEDKRCYGSRAHRRGGEAEQEFQRLVPAAMPANKLLERNCPAFDFDVGGILVDVKYSSIRTSSGAWGFQFAKRKPIKPDFYCAFFATDPSGALAGGYRLFLVPHFLFDGRNCVTLSPDDTGHDLLNFEIEPGELAPTLAEAARP